LHDVHRFPNPNLFYISIFFSIFLYKSTEFLFFVSIIKIENHGNVQEGGFNEYLDNMMMEDSISIGTGVGPLDLGSQLRRTTSRLPDKEAVVDREKRYSYRAFNPLSVQVPLRVRGGDGQRWCSPDENGQRSGCSRSRRIGHLYRERTGSIYSTRRSRHDAIRGQLQSAGQTPLHQGPDIRSISWHSLQFPGILRNPVTTVPFKTTSMFKLDFSMRGRCALCA